MRNRLFLIQPLDDCPTDVRLAGLNTRTPQAVLHIRAMFTQPAEEGSVATMSSAFSAGKLPILNFLISWLPTPGDTYSARLGWGSLISGDLLLLLLGSGSGSFA